MILSKRYGFLFIHSPKTSGDVMTLHLEPYADEVDKLAGKHLTARQMKKKLFDRGDSLFNYYSFGFIRNPWELRHSHYYYSRLMLDRIDQIDDGLWEWKDSLRKTEGMSFKDYVLQTMQGSALRWFFQDDGGNDLVSFVGNYHNPRDWYRVLHRLDMPIIERKHGNVSDRPKDYTKEYDKEMKEFVEAVAEPEIKRFGFKFGK